MQGMSPIMAAIKEDNIEVVKMIADRHYVYPPNKTYLENQIQGVDLNGNNVLHHAFQTENAEMIDLLLRNSYGMME